MLRWVLGSLSVLALCGVLAVAADDKKTDKKSKDQREAKITKVDAKKGTVTVQMKDKNGKQTEKTFKLAEDVEYLDSTGKVATVDVFTSGDWVLIVEREGKVKQLKKQDAKKTDKSEKKDKSK